LSPRLLKNSVHFITVIMAALTLYTAGHGLDENTFFTVTINIDGSAKWVVEHRYPLKGEEDVEAFKAVAANVSAEVLGNYRSRLEQVVKEASEAVGRNMELRDFTVRAYDLPTPTAYVGVVVLEFTWTGFASVKDGKLYIGEVFVGGLSLGRGETLTFNLPEGYVVVESFPKPDEADRSSLVWYGPKAFPHQKPMVVLSKSTEKDVTGPVNGVLMFMIVAALSTAGLLSALTVLILSKRRGGKIPGDGFEAVLEVLCRHGGVASQSTIVEETGFSKSSVSMILSALESSGHIVRVKKGRTKVVRLVR